MAAVAVIMIAAHALLMIAPLLWLGFFAVVVLLFATRTMGHHRPEQHRSEQDR